MQCGVLYLYDRSSDELWAAAAVGVSMSSFRIPAARGFVGHCHQTRQTVVVRNAAENEHYDSDIESQLGLKLLSVLCAPIINSAGQCVGVVQGINKDLGFFNERDVQLLEMFCDQAAAGVENALLYQQVQGLNDQLQAQHQQLQQAYQDIEARNTELDTALRRIRIGRRIILGFLALVFVSVGAMLLTSLGGDESSIDYGHNELGENYQTLTLNPTELSASLDLRGQIQPLSVVNHTSSLQGTVAQRHFEYGQSVNKGDLLLRLDTSQLEADIRSARVARIQALEQVQRLRNWDKSSEMSRARRGIERLSFQITNLENQLTQSQRLLEKGIIARTEVDSQRQQLHSLKSELDSAQEELKVIRLQGGEDEMRVAQLQLRNAEAELTRLEKQKQGATVHAEVSGIVVQPVSQDERQPARDIERGTPVSPGDVLVVVADMSGYSVQARVDETQVDELAIGQKAVVVSDAFDDIQLNGEISHVSSQAISDKQRSGPPQFEVTIRIVDPPEQAKDRVRLGMSARMRVETYSNPRALMLPYVAVQMRGQQPTVMRINAQGEPEAVGIETGVTTADKVEVVSGLSPGDVVAIP